MDNQKTKTFKVLSDLMPEFADRIAEYDLPCEVMGVTKKSKIILEVTYTPEKKEFIHQLTDLIEDYKQQEETEQEDD